MSSETPRVAFYGDDFTGSVDALLQFARHGWSGRLFVGAPGAHELARAAAECDVVGIAGIARSLPTEEIETEVRPAFTAIAALRPDVLQYKACSTADSSPSVGSLGRVIEIGREVIGARPVPVLFAQPDFGRYTVFGHHFAVEAGTVYRLDRQPTMSTHPATPMTESDLALHLSRQTDLPIGNIPFTTYDDDLASRITSSGAAAVVLDAATEEHVTAIGAAIARLPRPVFALGSGGLSWGIAAANSGDAAHAGLIPTSTPARGPVLAVSGSRSPQTRRQVDAAAHAGWLVKPLPLDIGEPEIKDVVATLRTGRSVALTSEDADPSLAGTHSVLQAISGAAATVIGTVARERVARRIIVCGGDTSSRVTTALGVESLSIAANPDGNIVLLAARSPDPEIDGLELLLKGGQVGSVDLFERIRTLH